MKILIVNDNDTKNIVKEHCKIEHFEIIEASNQFELINILKNNDIDLVILEILMEGYSTIREIRNNYNIPIIVLSEKKEEYDKLLCFELGIDDYITKPFSPKELIARIKAVNNRYKNFKNNYTYKSLTIDYLGHKVTINNKEIKLTPKEYELLCFFIKNKGIVLTRETLLNKIWGYNSYGDDRTVDTHIKMLRNNLKDYRYLIITIRGVGYKYEEEQ